MPAESLPRFQQVQREMTDWLREPERKPAPDIELRRLNIYRELFFNNVRDFVENAYPMLKSLLPEEQWSALVTDFFAEHRCQSPYFRDISLEFRQWMESARTDLLTARPWIQELLHYEWVELAAECAEVEDDAADTSVDARVDDEGDLLAGIPVVGACVWPLVYRWPVHTFVPGEPPADTPPEYPTCLIVFRAEDDSVRFVAVSAVTARLLELLQAGSGQTGRAALQQLAGEAGYADVDAFVTAGQGMLADLQAQGIIRGARAA